MKRRLRNSKNTDNGQQSLCMQPGPLCRLKWQGPPRCNNGYCGNEGDCPNGLVSGASEFFSSSDTEIASLLHLRQRFFFFLSFFERQIVRSWFIFSHYSSSPEMFGWVFYGLAFVGISSSRAIGVIFEECCFVFTRIISSLFSFGFGKWFFESQTRKDFLF